MPEKIIPQTFVDKWQHTTLKECSAYQQLFLDLCVLIITPPGCSTFLDLAAV